jgi:hypothetical protein
MLGAVARSNAAFARSLMCRGASRAGATPMMPSGWCAPTSSGGVPLFHHRRQFCAQPQLGDDPCPQGIDTAICVASDNRRLRAPSTIRATTYTRHRSPELRVPLCMTAFGASRPLRRIPAIVSFLNPQPALSLVGGNRSSCPEADTHDHPHERRGRVVSCHS